MNQITRQGRQCTAQAKGSGERCQNPARRGWEVCAVHGAGKGEKRGGRPATHGRYSALKREELRRLIEQHEADPDPLNIFPELAAARALFQDYIERYDEWRDALIAWHSNDSDKPRQLMDISDAYRILSEVTKIAERIEKVRAANAISRPDLMRVLSEMGRVVSRHVEDPETLEKIKDDWLTIRAA